MEVFSADNFVTFYTFLVINHNGNITDDINMVNESTHHTVRRKCLSSVIANDKGNIKVDNNVNTTVVVIQDVTTLVYIDF